MYWIPNVNKYDNVVIFGGSGYIGSYIVNYLVFHKLAKKIILADIKTPRKEVWAPETSAYACTGAIEYQHCDVKEKIKFDLKSVDIIFNLAAIHREPGHEPYEYFETNIKGAENVVEFSETVDCNTIVFTSSIAPYGHADEQRDEDSPVVPYSPYGSSKLVAEKIHQGWNNKNNKRKLAIVRPGVIYGPYEDGNVPRLKQALKKNAFCYVGNHDIQKAGGYVKELVRSIFWVIDHMETQNKGFVLFNFSFATPPSLKQYVEAVKKVLGVKRFVPNIPYPIILGLSHVISFFSSLMNIKQPIHPGRIKKLKVNNLILPTFLVNNGYEFYYDLESSLLDWKKDVPDEW
jgi:nucleoside-diphosphate-sugar epimerase